MNNVRSRTPRTIGRSLVLLAALVAGNAWAGADDFVNFAGISTTMGVQTSRICVGEPYAAGIGNPALGCPTYAPSLTTAGDVSVTGNLSATKFIGNGSLLTGLPAQTPDWYSLTNIPAQVQAVSTSGAITLV